ncbi:cytochrome P450-18 [Coleophoma cylindrospora]|uniref:Cytochrome P450-18 n=1 Tax=Coleophoma cylindrospora TaxID=1849047 RepID=A0A3D8S111_9HELO|nr:cytochrome P450-18 [Coleophoma cylindrospora]
MLQMSLVQGSAVLAVLYIVFGVIYRLYLSPISKIPGPKVAAVTRLYELYHDVINYGRYYFKITDLHKQYGPIVRISPYEVHISDPDFYDTLYASTSTNRKDRWGWYAAGLGIPNSTLGTVEQGLHRRRRAAMSPFFSKQNVQKLQPTIKERANMLVSRLEKLCNSGEVVVMSHEIDVVMQYCFGKSDHRLEAEGFDPSFHKTSFSAGTAGNLMRNMNWIMKLTKSLPESISMKMSPEMSSFIILKRERMDQIEKIRNQMAEKSEETDTTMFHTLLRSDLPESERSTSRLAEEAVLLAGAGTHTTSWTLSVALYHLLADPKILKKLKDELENAIPDPNESTPLPKLESLPYLTGVIKEGIRLGYGNASRIPRIALDKPIKYQDWEIPVGVPVSMAAPDVHHNEQIFPESYAFHPERWTEDTTGQLDKYLVSFTKGPRNCLGLNLAWAELYIGLSTIFRVFGSVAVRGSSDIGVMDLFETDIGDVEMYRDALFPIAKDGTKGIRVRLSK